MNYFLDYIRNMLSPYGMTTLESIGFRISIGIGILFTVLYTYQFVYVFIACIKKPKTYPATDQTKHYAILIAARNEEKVIPQLLKSIQGQTYPKDLIDVYVIADNCTDRTADVCREMGAIVYERQNKDLIGKGYALQFLFRCIGRDKGLRSYDAYMVIDADNVLRPNYIEEMDKAHCAGNRILTSYRNSKNYGASWVSAGYSLWFMRESRHLQNPRSLLGTSAAISGTGFLIDSEIIERNGGWKHFLLTEDIEFSVDSILQGERVGYCHQAELFDEQPETFRQSWRQRMRWAKGFFQVFRHYGKGLGKGALKLQWSCYDMTMNIMPAFFLSTIQLGGTTILLILHAILHHELSSKLLGNYLYFFGFSYALLFVLGFITLITEWKHIYCPKWKAILHTFTFPIFMLSYLPISLVALFSKVEWKPIQHRYNVDPTEIEKQSKGAVLTAVDGKGAADEDQEEQQ